MTDYLEEHLGNAEALLERIRQLEQSASGLSGRVVSEEKVDKSDDFSEKVRDTEEKSGIVSKEGKWVYDTASDVNPLKEIVDDLDVGLGIRKKEQDIPVNRQAKSGDNEKNPGRIETTSKAEETGARTNAERAENRPALSAQLEELDRAVSALTTLLPEGQSGYPVSLSPTRAPAVDPTVTGIPGEAWSAPGTPAGADLAYGGTQSWAEQADRMFRRDSRRYDGGFYLY